MIERFLIEHCSATLASIKAANLCNMTFSSKEELEDQISEEIKQQRLDAIMRRQLDISLELNREKIGKVLDVITEEQDEDGSYIGRTIYDAPEIDNSVIFTSEREIKPGDIVKVLIQDAFDYDLTGMEV